MRKRKKRSCLIKNIAIYSYWGYISPMKRIKDESGKRYGKLLVIKTSYSKNGLYWLCRCDCGNETIVKGTNLRYGTTHSCGCGSIEQAKKNLETSAKKRRTNIPYIRKLKDLRRNMIDRCCNKKNKRYYDYGGRGIKVCDEWQSGTRVFYAWCTKVGYKPGLQINRIDNNGNYEPSNCNFVTQLVNVNNTRGNHYVTWGGKTQTIAMWARDLGVRPQALQHRFTRNWPLEKAMTQPFRNWDDI